MLEKILPPNVHPVERGIRVILGIVLLSLTVAGPKTMWGLVGLVPLLTGLIGSCPVYTILGLSTARVKSR